MSFSSDSGSVEFLAGLSSSVMALIMIGFLWILTSSPASFFPASTCSNQTFPTILFFRRFWRQAFHGVFFKSKDFWNRFNYLCHGTFSPEPLWFVFYIVIVIVLESVKFLLSYLKTHLSSDDCVESSDSSLKWIRPCIS